MRPGTILQIASRSRDSAVPSAATPPLGVVNVVQHLQRGDFPRAIAAFCRVSDEDARSCPALHEALVLACAQVPDAHAASTVLAAAPSPTLASFSHCATAHIRERNIGAAVDVLERLQDSGLPLHPRIFEFVERAAKRRAGAAHASWTRRKPRLAAPTVDPEVDAGKSLSLLRRLGRISRLKNGDPGLGAISLSGTDLLDSNGGGVTNWIMSRNAAHSQSLLIAGEGRSSCGAVPLGSLEIASASVTESCTSHSSSTIRRDNVSSSADPSSAHSSIPPEAAFRSARGKLSRIDSIWASVCTSPVDYQDSNYLAMAVSAYLSCGWRGSLRSLDAISLWLDVHARDPNSDVLASLSASPTRRAMLLTAVTSTLAASASTSAKRALAVYDAFSKLAVPTFYTSLPLSGAVYKVLRHSRLSLSETMSRIDRVRGQLVQLDERSFSMALSAILECAAPASEKWAVANTWVQKMREAGIPLTHHTYNAFALQLRYMNDPEMTSFLLRDMARSGVRPTAYTYGLMFESCIASGTYNANSRRHVLPTSSMLAMLEAIEGHMIILGVDHDPFSRFALARACAHLGQMKKAKELFNIALSSANSANASQEKPSQARREFNQMISTAAHCRCVAPEGPASAFDFFEEMQELSITPTASTLESLLAACVRLGDHTRGLKYVSLFDELRKDSGMSFLLRRGGVESLLAILAKAGNAAAWIDCELCLQQSFEALEKQNFPPAVSRCAVQLAVLAFARRGERGICEKLIAMSGVGDLEESGWELALDGTGDFERVREVRRRKQRVQQHVHNVAVKVEHSSSFATVEHRSDVGRKSDLSNIQDPGYVF